MFDHDGNGIVSCSTNMHVWVGMTDSENFTTNESTRHKRNTHTHSKQLHRHITAQFDFDNEARKPNQ